MIAPLRARHVEMITALAFLVPALFVAGLSYRTSIPASDKTSPGPLEFDPATIVVEVEFVGTAVPLRALVARSEDAASEFVAVVDGLPADAAPDLLLYWQERGEGAVLTDDARRLGRLAPGRRNVLALPETTLHGAGRLVVYSLGHREWLAAAMLPAIGEPAADTHGATP